MIKHYMYVPFTGLGLYGGFRGNRWLRNRIKIFKQFVVPSLQAQTNQNFTIWISWRREEKNNKQVEELLNYLEPLFPERVIFTYSGLCFYDDKFDLAQAREKLATNLHHTIQELINDIGDVTDVLMTIQPSDDCYRNTAVEEIQYRLNDSEIDAFGYAKGYMMNYLTKELREYNPETNPPFYTISFPKATFIDPFKHMQHTALKEDAGQYPKGTPLPSHEYVGKCLEYTQRDSRGFLVGTHGENVSTHFNHPYAGKESLPEKHLKNFGLMNTEPLRIPFSVRKWIMRKLPHPIRRKLRYYLGEKLYQPLYNWIRS